MTPKRIQLRRTKGWRLPPGAVSVARPSRWGNPFRVGDRVTVSGTMYGPAVGRYDGKELYFSTANTIIITPSLAVALYRDNLEEMLGADYVDEFNVAEALETLRGKDLACWCKPGDPCHADVLLELANA